MTMSLRVHGSTSTDQLVLRPVTKLPLFEVAGVATTVNCIDCEGFRIQLLYWYAMCPVPVDDLPYSEELHTMTNRFSKGWHRELNWVMVDTASTNEFAALYLKLLQLRKDGAIPQGEIERTSSPMPKLSPIDLDCLLHLLPSRAEVERLPYSDDFDAIYQTFNQQRKSIGREPLNKRQIWRSVISTAKSRRTDERQTMPLFGKANDLT